jgi:outer membrane protein assembly factor BamE (lipoprotein component of BamABCDE complex)
MVVALFSGCLLYIPTPNYHDTDSRKNVSQATTNSIVSGQTTKEEVVLMRGEPDVVDESETSWTYKWTKIRGVMVLILIPSTGVGGEDRREYELIITFDKDGTVEKTELNKRTL